MRAGVITMQEMYGSESRIERASVDTASAGFYSYGVFCPTYPADACCMCLP